MPRVLTDMDEAYREDSDLERRCRDTARQLEGLADRPRIEGTALGAQCRTLADNLRDRADGIVRVWD